MEKSNLLAILFLASTVHASDIDQVFEIGREYGIVRQGSYVTWYGSILDKEHARKYGDLNFLQV